MVAALERQPDRIVTIPYLPRNWANKLHASFARWAVIVLHRRAGKTTAVLNHHQRAALDNGWEEKRLRSLLPNITPAHLRELMKRRVRDVEMNLSIGEAGANMIDLNLHDLLQDLLAEGLEEYDLIEPIEKLGTKRLL